MSTTTWEIDPVHSSIQFKVRHMMIANVKGEFTTVRGTLNLDNDDISRSTLDASIDVASINTRDSQRDTHLKSADFFDVERFPTMTFRSTAIRPAKKGELTLAGDLTIHGVTKPVTLEVEGPTPEGKDPWGNTRMGASAMTKINRKDFGLMWNAPLEAGGVLVGDDVNITLDLEFVKKA